MARTWTAFGRPLPHFLYSPFYLGENTSPPAIPILGCTVPHIVPVFCARHKCTVLFLTTGQASCGVAVVACSVAKYASSSRSACKRERFAPATPSLKESTGQRQCTAERIRSIFVRSVPSVRRPHTGATLHSRAGGLRAGAALQTSRRLRTEESKHLSPPFLHYASTSLSPTPPCCAAAPSASVLSIIVKKGKI
jgi:hypothetical protein